MVSNTSRNGGDNMIVLNRRRTMGEKVLTPIERLKQLGCIFWFPLDGANKLNDVVGGRTIVEDISNRIIFTANNCNIHLSTVSSRISHIDISDLTSNDFIDGNFTTFFSACRVSDRNLRGFAGCWQVNNKIVASAIDENGTSATINWTNDEWKTGVIVRYSDDNRIVYGGTGDTLISNTPSIYPDIWSYSSIDLIAWRNYENKYINGKNFLLFNKALTKNEIEEVFQIIRYSDKIL